MPGPGGHQARQIYAIDDSGSLTVQENPDARLSDDFIAQRRAEYLARQNRFARAEGSPGCVCRFDAWYATRRDSQLFAAIRARDRDRVGELLQSGADANAMELVPWWFILPFFTFPGPFLWPFLVCCTIPGGAMHSRAALHVAMEDGDAAAVQQLLDAGANPRKAALFWNCCNCFCFSARSKRYQDILFQHRPQPWDGPEQLQAIRQLIMDR